MTYLSLSILIVIIVSYCYAETEAIATKFPLQSETVLEEGTNNTGIKFLLNSFLQAVKKIGFKQEQEYFILNLALNKSQMQLASLSSHSKEAKFNSNKTGDIRALLVQTAIKNPNFPQENISVVSAVHNSNPPVVSNNTKSHVRLNISVPTNGVNEHSPMKTVMEEVNEVKSNSASVHEHLSPQSFSELRSDSKMYDANSVQQNIETSSDLLESRTRSRRPKRQQEHRIRTRSPMQEQEISTQTSLEPTDERKNGLKKYIEGTRCVCFTTVHCQCCVALHLYDGLSPHQVCMELEADPNKILLRGSARVDNQTIYSGQIDPSIAPICLPQLPSLCISINHIDINNREICAKLNLLVFTLMKFPCILLENGSVTIEPNHY